MFFVFFNQFMFNNDVAINQSLNPFTSGNYPDTDTDTLKKLINILHTKRLSL